MLKAHTQHALKQCQIHMYPFTTHSFTHAIFLLFSIIHRDTHMDPKDYRSYDTAIVTVLGSIYSSTISTVVFQTFFFLFSRWECFTFFGRPHMWYCADIAKKRTRQILRMFEKRCIIMGAIENELEPFFLQMQLETWSMPLLGLKIDSWITQ